MTIEQARTGFVMAKAGQTIHHFKKGIGRNDNREKKIGRRMHKNCHALHFPNYDNENPGTIYLKAKKVNHE